MYQHIFSQGFSAAERAITAMRATSFDNIRAGMFVGYVFTGKHFEQYWHNAYVIGVDRDTDWRKDCTVAIVQLPDGTIETFHSDSDSLAIWED